MAKGYATNDEVQKYLEVNGVDAAWNIANSDADAYEENIVRDMVGKVFRFRALSEKQVNFMKSLIKRIEERPQIEEQRQAEWNAAKELPVGRQTFRATILTVKDTDYGLKLLLRHEDGWKVYGSCPRGVYKPQKGDIVEMTATLKQSEKDTKFGFYSRPLNASIPVRKDVFKVVYTSLAGNTHEQELATEVEAKNYFDWAVGHEKLDHALLYHNGNIMDSWGT